MLSLLFNEIDLANFSPSLYIEVSRLWLFVETLLHAPMPTYALQTNILVPFNAKKRSTGYRFQHTLEFMKNKERYIPKGKGCAKKNKGKCRRRKGSTLNSLTECLCGATAGALGCTSFSTSSGVGRWENMRKWFWHIFRYSTRQCMEHCSVFYLSKYMLDNDRDTC